MKALSEIYNIMNPLNLIAYKLSRFIIITHFICKLGIKTAQITFGGHNM